MHAKFGCRGTTVKGSAKMANFGLLLVLFLYSSCRVQITP